MKDLEKMLMGKKAGSEKMSDQAVQAKMDVLKELMDICKEQMLKSNKSGMEEMQKVTVAAPSKEELVEGLETAQEITEDMPEMKSEDKKEESEEKETSIMDLMSDDEDSDSMFAKRK
jgi:hypothetical protein